MLSEGLPTSGIDALKLGSCVGCSQVFLCIDPKKLGGDAAVTQIADSVVEYVQGAEPDEAGRTPEYPGEGAVRRRERQTREGIEVDDGVWAEVQALAVAG